MLKFLGVLSFLLFLLMLVFSVNPRWISKGEKKYTRKQTLLSALVIFVLFCVFVVNDPSNTKVPTSDSSVATVAPVTKTPEQIAKEKADATAKQKAEAEANAKAKAAVAPEISTTKASNLLSQKELLDTLSWTNDQFNEVYSRFQGLQPGTYQQLSAVDPGWVAFQGEEVRALWAKHDSVQGKPDGVDLKNPVPGLIQADVGGAVSFAACAVGDMGGYLNGDTNKEEVTKDIEDYKTMYDTVLKEVKQGKMIDK